MQFKTWKTVEQDFHWKLNFHYPWLHVLDFSSDFRYKWSSLIRTIHELRSHDIEIKPVEYLLYYAGNELLQRDQLTAISDVIIAIYRLCSNQFYFEISGTYLILRKLVWVTTPQYGSFRKLRKQMHIELSEKF